MSVRRILVEPQWRDPLIGIPEELIDYYATAFHLGGWFMVTRFEDYLRAQIMTPAPWSRHGVASMTGARN